MPPRRTIRLPQVRLDNTARPGIGRARPQPSPEPVDHAPRGVLPFAVAGEAARRLEDHLSASRTHLDEIARAMRQIGSTTGPAVLETGTALLDSTGIWDASRYRIPYKAIAVINPTAGPLVVASMARQGSAPGQGAGVVIIPANSFLSANLEGSALSMYGAAGALVTYSVLAGRVQPYASALSPSGFTLVEPANPAAASPYTYTLTAPASLQSAYANFTASAAVANRFVRLQIADAAGNILASIPGTGAVVASTSTSSSWAQGIGTAANGAVGLSSGGAPIMTLQTGWTVSIVVSGIQAGDQLSNIALVLAPIT